MSVLPSAEQQIRLSVASRLDNVVFVAASINAICIALGLSSQEAGQIELCVVEAVTNVIEHAYMHQPGCLVEVLVTVEGSRLVLQICDWGSTRKGRITKTLNFDPTDIPNLPEGGMGLFLINSLMDEVVYTSHEGMNILTMVKVLPAQH